MQRNCTLCRLQVLNKHHVNSIPHSVNQNSQLSSEADELPTGRSHENIHKIRFDDGKRALTLCFLFAYKFLIRCSLTSQHQRKSIAADERNAKPHLLQDRPL